MESNSEGDDDDAYADDVTHMSKEEMIKYSHHARCLMHHLDHLDGGPETEYSLEFNKWMEFVEQIRSDAAADPLQSGLVCVTNPAVGASRQLMALLRDCFINHRWSAAGKVLLDLMSEPMCTPYVIWRCTCEVMWQLRHDMNGEAEKFVKQMLALRTLPSYALVLENMYFLLSDGRTVEANEALLGCEVRPSDKSSSYLSTMMKAYKGMLAYSEWVDTRHKLQEYNCDEGRKVILSQRVEDLSRRACHTLEVIKSSKLTMDMFIVKYCEILESHERLGEALTLLEWYQSSHSDNPNAHLYVLQFYQRHPDKASQSALREAMKRCIDTNPTSPLVIDVAKDLDITEKETLMFLFNSLDYYHWRNEAVLWEKLASTLRHICERADDNAQISVLRSLWTARKNWWPNYHFSRTNHGMAMDHVIVVCCLLCGYECKHTKRLLEISSEHCTVILSGLDRSLLLV